MQMSTHGTTTTSSSSRRSTTVVPRRPYGSLLSNHKLPSDLPIVGLGCSSFSTFFWTSEEEEQQEQQCQQQQQQQDNVIDGTRLTVDNMTPNHPRVQEWMETIRYAILECGIDFLDTAPWYGHGMSETVIGYALDRYPELKTLRSRMTINTKVGRYEADPTFQFDFSHETTRRSIDRSIQRMKCDYIDVLQLHDPEFAPTLEVLLKETLPAMREAQVQGQCRALGMTGYPLHVQYQILQHAMIEFGQNIFDQALTYCHFNLHNTRLIREPIIVTDDDPSSSSSSSSLSYADYCIDQKMGVVAAAPLSMGLLTPPSPDDDDGHCWSVPEWHPASDHLKQACQQASLLCSTKGVNLASLATLFALSEPRITSTLIGCKNIEQVQRAAEAALRFHDYNNNQQQQQEVFDHVLNDKERQAFKEIQDDVTGPFATVWKSGDHHWDGIAAVRQFWASVPSVETTTWQHSTPPHKQSMN